MANFMTDVIFGPLAHSMATYDEAGSSEDMLVEISDEIIDSMLADLPQDVAGQVCDELHQYAWGGMTNSMNGALDQEQEAPIGIMEDLPETTDDVTQGFHNMALRTPARPLTSAVPTVTAADATHNWVHHSSHILSSSPAHFFGVAVSYNLSLQQLRYRALVEPNIEVSDCEIIEGIPTPSAHANHDHEVPDPQGAEFVSYQLLVMYYMFHAKGPDEDKLNNLVRFRGQLYAENGSITVMQLLREEVLMALGEADEIWWWVGRVLEGREEVIRGAAGTR